MPSINIRPSIRSWDRGTEDYEALARGLQERGFTVSLKQPLPPPPEGLPLAAGMDFGIDLLVNIGHDVLIAIEAIVVQEIARKVVAEAKRRGQETPVMGVIYGPDGKILREVSWDPQRTEGDSGGSQTPGDLTS